MPKVQTAHDQAGVREIALATPTDDYERTAHSCTADVEKWTHHASLVCFGLVLRKSLWSVINW